MFAKLLAPVEMIVYALLLNTEAYGCVCPSYAATKRAVVQDKAQFIIAREQIVASGYGLLTAENSLVLAYHCLLGTAATLWWPRMVVIRRSRPPYKTDESCRP